MRGRTYRKLTDVKYRILVGKSEEKIPLGRHRHSWERNIEMDHMEIGCEVVDWIQVAQKRIKKRAIVNMEMSPGFLKRMVIF
jgi:hypothetical protein